ncbi:MAG: hypothetical protein C4K58_02280 [Flavobacteriaceae bacterium]|nr:MAG: hypothetical protein C4K58_02280 [Flavobacteriaceae bacterium]
MFKKKNNMNKLLFFVAFLAFGFGFSQSKSSSDSLVIQDIVVTATKTKVSPKQIGRVVHVVDSADLQNMQGKNILEILKSVPGIEIGGSGNAFGSNFSIISRGGRNKNALVLIDGIPVFDPSQIENNYYDLNLVNPSSLEKIEVVNSGGSTLYGSGADAVVINLMTKKNYSNEKPLAQIGVSAGSFGTLDTHYSLGGKKDKLSYNFRGSYLKTDGISAINIAGSDPDLDGGDKHNLGVNFQYDLGKTKLFTDFNFNQIIAQYDAFFGDDKYTSQNKKHLVGLENTHGAGLFKATAQYLETQRDQSGEYTSRVYLGQAEEYFKFSEELDLLVGYELRSENYFANSSFSGVTSARENQFSSHQPYVQLQAKWKNLNLVSSARYVFHSAFEDAFVYHVSPSYLFKNIAKDTDLSIRSSLSTAYITPTLYQLFTDDLYTEKNPAEFSPENSLTLEGGISLYVGKKFTLNGTYFNRTTRDEILYRNGVYDENFSLVQRGMYFNSTGKNQYDGVEVDFQYKPFHFLSFGSSYTYTNLKNVQSVAQSLRIPTHKISGFVRTQPSKNLNVGLQYTYVDQREDQDFFTWPYPLVNLPAYHLLDFHSSYNINKNTTCFLMLNNLLNQNYQEVFGYQTKGRNFMLGLNFTF